MAWQRSVPCQAASEGKEQRTLFTQAALATSIGVSSKTI